MRIRKALTCSGSSLTLLSRTNPRPTLPAVDNPFIGTDLDKDGGHAPIDDPPVILVLHQFVTLLVLIRIFIGSGQLHEPSTAIEIIRLISKHQRVIGTVYFPASGSPLVTRQGLINDLTGLALEGSLLVRLSVRLKQIASLGKADLEILPQFLGIQPIRPGVTHKVSTPEVGNV